MGSEEVCPNVKWQYTRQNPKVSRRFPGRQGGGGQRTVVPGEGAAEAEPGCERLLRNKMNVVWLEPMRWSRTRLCAAT